MCLLYCACHAKCIFPDPLQMSHACHRFWKCHKTLTFCKVHNPLRLPSERSKVLRTCQFFTLLTWKCASRHSGVHFFDIATSKSAPKLKCFVYFDFEMCFPPQRRALFRHHSFQSGPNMVRFSSFIWPAGWLRTCRFSEPTFRHKSLAKHCVSRLSYLFAHLDLLSSSLLFSDSSHLCFSSVHIVGSLTSKLPSTIR